MLKATPVKKVFLMNCSQQSQPGIRPPIWILRALCFMLLAGCSLEDGKSREFDTSNARRAKLETNVGLDDLRDLAKPPSQEESSGVSASIAEGRGLNLEPKTLLFSENLRDSDDRLDRLEQAVQDIRNDFDEVAPAISRLVATEKDIQDLLAQLRTLLENDSEPQPLTGVEPPMVIEQDLPETMEAAPAPPPPETPKPVQTASSSGAPSVRVGDHADKTRIVFETPTKQTYVVNFDETEQLVLVESPSTIPDSSATIIKANSKRVSAANVSADGGKSLLAITTQGIARITPGVEISPNAENPNYRYFFDMMTSP